MFAIKLRLKLKIKKQMVDLGRTGSTRGPPFFLLARIRVGETLKGQNKVPLSSSSLPLHSLPQMAPSIRYLPSHAQKPKANHLLN